MRDGRPQCQSESAAVHRLAERTIERGDDGVGPSESCNDVDSGVLR